MQFASGSSHPTPLHDEDDVQVLTRASRLETENGALNARCSELILLLAERDESIAQLRATIQRMGGGGAIAADRTGANEGQLQREVARLRDRLLVEEQRAAQWEAEARRRSSVL
jgi:DNA-binding transcriptional regulator PaaX